MTAPTRYPFEPLATEAAAPTVGTLAGWIGVSARTIHRWARTGIPARQADHAAIAIGSHPSYIWPEEWQLPTYRWPCRW